MRLLPYHDASGTLKDIVSKAAGILKSPQIQIEALKDFRPTANYNSTNVDYLLDNLNLSTIWLLK